MATDFGLRLGFPVERAAIRLRNFSSLCPSGISVLEALEFIRGVQVPKAVTPRTQGSRLRFSPVTTNKSPVTISFRHCCRSDRLTPYRRGSDPRRIVV